MFRQITDAQPPNTKNRVWPQTSIDRFVLAKQEAAGLTPAVDANPVAVLRRLYFDLLGLPPTPNQVRVFLKAAAEDRRQAIGQVVDQLLESPDFGKRWGRHGLDIVRFSESSGGGRTRVFDHAWRYRDYVIRAFNEDRPYNRFLPEQIAGDLLPSNTVAEARVNLTATSFLAIGPTNYELQDKQLLDMDVIDEQLNTIGKSMLGMTIGCARCHDHKFDPIPTADYYALAGILLSTQSLTHSNVSNPIMRPLPLDEKQQELLAGLQRLTAPLKAEISKLQKQLKPRVSKKLTLKGLGLSRLASIVVDDEKAKFTDRWTRSTFEPAYVNKGYRFQSGSAAAARFQTPLVSGRYEVRVSYNSSSGRGSNVLMRVLHADGEHQARINCKNKPNIDGLFVSLGEFRFEDSGAVIIGGKAADGVVIADAVQWLPVSDTSQKQRPSIIPKGKTKQIPEELKQQKVLSQRIKQLQNELQTIEKKGPTNAAPVVMSVQDNASSSECHVLIRGNVHNKGQRVPRGFLSVLTISDQTSAIPESVSGRL